MLQEALDSPLSDLGQDFYGSWGAVAELESYVADLLGKPAAVFMPSGTMAQQIALRIWCDDAGISTVAFHPLCHLEIHERMAYSEVHHLRAVLLGEPDRLFTLEDLSKVEEPLAALLIELPQREIGGQLPTWDELKEICDYASSKGIRLHMDGARLWECAPYYARSYAEIAALFDSVYVSFYKLLGGLPGAMLAGPELLIAEARIWQRRHGGNLHQQSPNAILGKIGLDRHLPQAPLYVAKAAEVAAILSECSDHVRVVPPAPPTNMMHLYFSGAPEAVTRAVQQITEEDGVALFRFVPEDGMVEISIGESALGLDASRLRELFGKLFRLAGSSKPEG